ncbi:MAG: RDD family protein [Williamsia sp.]|nr:RDD family protein [Williamsia sp.]
MSSIKITTTQNIDIEYELAGIGERIVATILDSLIKAAYVFIAMMIFTRMHMSETGEWIYGIVLVVLPWSFYSLISEVFMNGQSLGKRTMNTRVVSVDGGQATVGQYIIRWLFLPIDFYFSFYACAFLTVVLSSRSQRLGDMIAGTIVIKTVIPRTNFQQTIVAPPPARPDDYVVTFPEAASLTDPEMQLIRDVVLAVRRTGNIQLAYHAAEKIKETIRVQSPLQPMDFLHVLMEDYQYLTSTM